MARGGRQNREGWKVPNLFFYGAMLGISGIAPGPPSVPPALDPGEVLARSESDLVPFGHAALKVDTIESHWRAGRAHSREGGKSHE
jgi:hypothetical protein